MSQPWTPEERARQQVHFDAYLNSIPTYREKLNHLRPSQAHKYKDLLARMDELEPRFRALPLEEWAATWLRPKEGTLAYAWSKLTREISQAAHVYIEMPDCEVGAVYRIRSRNLVIGVYDGKQGFIGIREKFGSEYLFTEYHWDQGPPYGTTHPLEKIGMLPEHIPAKEELRTVCNKTLRPVEYRSKPDWKGYEEGPKGDWVYTDTGEKIPEYPESSAVSISNQALFDYLKPLSDAEYLRLDAERGEDRTVCARCKQRVFVKLTRLVDNGTIQERVCSSCPDKEEAV